MLLTVVYIRLGPFSHDAVDSEPRRSIESFKDSPPERFRSRRVLLLEPGNEIAIGTHRREPEVLAIAVRLIQRPNFLHYNRAAPSIEQDMMKAQHELDDVFCPPKHSHADQRSFGKIKTPFPNRTKIRKQAFILLM